MPIPVYSAHDVIEPFNCKSDLRQCAEFYIDETTINYYETPLTIEAPLTTEAGFYSSDLISYHVNTLYMDTKNIKYKIVKKKALKPDTFKKYLKYIFDTFPEAGAK